MMKLEYKRMEYFILREMIFHPFKVKKYLKTLLKEISGSVLHFSHTQFDILCFLLVKQYSDFGQIKFYNYELLFKQYTGFVFKKAYILLNIYRILINCIYNINMIMKIEGETFILAINDTFFKKYKIDIVDNNLKFFDIIHDVLKNNQISLKEYDIMFIEEKASYYKRCIHDNSYKKMIEYFKKQKAVIKEHPNILDKEKAFNTNDKYPDYLPVEFLLSNIKKAVVSLTSTALFSSAKYGNLQVISLIDLLEWKDNKRKEFFKNDLVLRGHNDILFPQNYKELDNLLGL